MRQGGSGGEGHQCYHLEPPVVPCEQNSVPVSLRGGAAQDVRRGDWGPRREGELWWGHTYQHDLRKR